MGLVSRSGILPITADQDTAGPLARTVTDAAILLGEIAGHDPNDPATPSGPVINPAGKYKQLRLFDPTKGTHEVQLWTSDQGFADQEVFVTYDRELVLRIAKFFGGTVCRCRKLCGSRYKY